MSAVDILAPPRRSLAQRAPDFFVWGAVLLLLMISFHPVDMQNFGKLFTNSDNMRRFGAELLKPDWTDWRLYVGPTTSGGELGRFQTFQASPTSKKTTCGKASSNQRASLAS